MGGYVNQDGGGWTELRVHGVSGTPPERMLAHPHVALVAGDAEAGFYRREWEAKQTSADTADERFEAYSWGGLTAGSGQRALWLLLTPFLLVNVAFFALPYAGVDDERKASRRTAEVVQRLFALSITLTFVLAVVLVSMDFFGWQCVRQSRNCTDRVSWLGFLSWSWLDLPGRRIAVTAALPLAVVGLLWWLANETWRELEAADVPPAPREEQQQTPLENRRMWNGESQVRRLRAAHVAAGFALVGVFLLAPFAGHGQGLRAVKSGAAVDSAWAGAGTFLFGLALGLLGLTVVLVCLPNERKQPDGDGQHRDRRDLYTLLPWLALVVSVLGAVVVWQPGVNAAVPVPGDARSQLPWLAGTVQVLAAVQVVLLLGMLVLLLTRARSEAGQSPAWCGLAAPALMMAAVVLAGVFAAGLALAVAHVLGKPAPTDLGPDAFVVPLVYFWGAALAVPVAAMALLLVGVGLWLVRRNTDTMLRDHVIPAFPTAKIAEALDAPDLPEHAQTLRRARHIAAAWSRAAVSDVGGRVSGAFAVLLAVLTAAGVVGYLVDRSWVYTQARWAVNIGDLLVGGFVAGLLYVGRQAYRNPRFRRTVGVLWDVGTFWPRATHPLAPPCYAERAVPDLIKRINYLGCTCGGHVLLSCHSQGTVIGAAVVMQLTYQESARVALLTYGSPLRRLYARFFPAYFGPVALRRTGAFLLGKDKPLDTSDGARPRWPWRNLYRPSDPIGGWILRDFEAVEISAGEWAADGRVGDNQDIDRRMIDPMFARTAGDSSYPAMHGHSGYADDPAYRASVEILRELRM
ncbi:hypothetical protein OG799_11305 [Micromonospora sp. NBC_00898]|uniref:hypothetical protein n=1 Tax=Micromonospora sp. NBC_00898 TaxID=2975981 RepID=UPI003863195A|nr:hypothetical protein OG799_11305 [Micromonospora sp. NBC_00898]